MLLLFFSCTNSAKLRREKSHSNFCKKNYHLSVDSAKKVTIIRIEVRDKSKDIP